VRFAIAKPKRNVSTTDRFRVADTAAEGGAPTPVVLAESARAIEAMQFLSLGNDPRAARTLAHFAA
jgi:hypothetical protein